MKSKYVWKPEKNEWLKRERKISFEIILEAIVDGGFKDLFEYRGSKQTHQGQKIMILEIQEELWKIPLSIQKNGLIFLRTAYLAE